MARALGIGEGSFRVLGTHPWIVGSWVAERFREGRIFLAGDSAHVTPPAGGFGASLGVHDAHNLCTKLGQLLAKRPVDQATSRFMDLWRAGRRPKKRHPSRNSPMRDALGRVLARPINLRSPGPALGSWRRRTRLLGASVQNP
jgi:2-polyprenyl-6-methoxyphenol hydroxylase-like FAD-dependent oxidoreductase